MIPLRRALQHRLFCYNTARNDGCDRPRNWGCPESRGGPVNVLVIVVIITTRRRGSRPLSYYITRDNLKNRYANGVFMGWLKRFVRKAILCVAGKLTRGSASWRWRTH